jgi:hypothetical protein
MSFMFRDRPIANVAPLNKDRARPIMSRPPKRLRGPQVRHIAVRRPAPETGADVAMAGLGSDFNWAAYQEAQRAQALTTGATALQAQMLASRAPTSGTSARPISTPLTRTGTVNPDKVAAKGDSGGSSWMDIFSSVTQGITNIGTQYLQYEAVKDQADASRREAQAAEQEAEAARLRAEAANEQAAYEARLAAQRASQANQQGSGMPGWVVPTLVVGGLAAVGFMVLKK